MKKLLSIVLAVAMLVSMFAVIPVMAEETEPETTTPADTTTLGDYYKFTFGADGDQYDYTVANKTVGDTTGQATYKGNTFYPFLTESADATKASAEYKTLTTSDGASYEVLEVKSAANSYLIPMTKEGKPFEMTPGIKYTINIKFFNPVCNTWGQLMLNAGTLNDKVSSYSKNVNGVTWKDGESTAKNTNKVAAPFRQSGGTGITSGNSYSAFLKEGTYAKDKIAVSCKCASYSTEEKPIECTHSSRYVTPYAEVTTVIGIPEANGTYNEETGAYDVKWSYADETPEDTTDDVYVEGNNYLMLTLGGGNVATYASTTPVYSNATKEEIEAAGTDSVWQIVSIEVASEKFKSSLSYSVDGEIVNIAEGDVGIALERFVPEIPEGKFFAGWYADEALTVPYTSETLEYGQRTVYAKFFGYGENLEIDFEDGSYPSTAAYWNEVGSKWPLFGYSYKGSSYTSTTNKGELEANLVRNGLSTTFPESAVAFYSDRTWGQPGGLMFANPDGTLFVPQAGEVYKITYKYNAPLYNGNKMSVNLVYGILNTMADKTTSGDKQFAKKILAYNEIEEVIAEWTEETVTVTIPENGEGYIPALGLSIDAVKKVTLYEDDGETVAGYDYGMIMLDYVKVEKVPTATVTFVDADEKETAVKFGIGGEIKYPAVKADNNGDAVWSLSKDEYIAPPAVAEEDVTVYAIVNPVIGFENYYSTQYANQSLDITVTDEMAYEGDKAAKLQLRGLSYLTSAPEDWETDWTKYFFIEEDGTATPLSGDAAPEFVKFKYAYTRKGSNEHSFALWNLPGGSFYKISFKYYVPAELTTAIKLRPYTNMYNLWAPGAIWYNDSIVIIPADTKTGEWLDGTIIINNEAPEGKDFLYITAFGVDNLVSNDVIYFDNFSYEVLETAGYVEYVNGDTVTKSVYVDGQQIVYPALETARQYDYVWSLSADKYVAVPETFTEDITVYAIKSEVIGFENYYQADYAKYSLNVTVSDDTAFNGNNAIKYQNLGLTISSAEPADWAEKYNTYFMFDEEGNIVPVEGEEAPVWEANKYISKRGEGLEHSIVLWNTPAGKSYKVSFKYFIPAELTTNVTMKPFTNNSNLWSPAISNGVPYGKVEYPASNFTIGADATVGEWVEGEFYFVSNANNKADILYIFLRSDVSGTEDIIYFDDFTLTEVQSASFILPEDATHEQGGVFYENVITVYAALDEEIVAPLVIDAEGNPVEFWADENGNKVAEFVNGGVYTVAPAFVYGDCNDDGAVDTTDLAALKLFLAGSGDAGLGADCDASGSIDTGDLAALKLFLAGTGDLGPAE